jgi:hypothetical protein
MVDKVDMWNDPGRPPIEGDITVSLTEHRQSICDSCESLKAYICDNCMCFMPLKIRFKSTSCPLGKW